MGCSKNALILIKNDFSRFLEKEVLQRPLNFLTPRGHKLPFLSLCREAFSSFSEIRKLLRKLQEQYYKVWVKARKCESVFFYVT